LLPLSLGNKSFCRGLGGGLGLAFGQAPDSLFPDNNLLADGDADLLKKK
jgi:hypothetical protein